MTKHILRIVSLIVVAGMLLAACAPQPQATPEPQSAASSTFKSKDPQTFVTVTFGSPDTLDPALDYENSGGHVLQNVYETLVFYKKDSISELVPVLASELPTTENGGISADGLTYTFKMRQGVKFHQGGDLTASDVAYTFQRGLLAGGTISPQLLLFEPIMGTTNNNDIADLLDPDGSAKLVDSRETMVKFDAGKLKDVCEQVKGAIQADDAAGTVTFKLAQPWGPFLVTLAGTWADIMDKEWVMANGGWDGDCATWQKHYAPTAAELNALKLGSAPNGTGPYKFDHWTPGEEVVLKANEDYWRKEPLWEGGPSGAPKIKTVIIKDIAEFSTRYAMFMAGDADYILWGSPADYPQLDELVGYSCDDTGKCETLDEKKPALRYWKQLGGRRTDIHFSFEVNTDGGNEYIGSGKLDGNGIPADFFKDVHVRKAFAYCFDYDTYLKDVMMNEGKRANNVMLFGEIGDDPNSPRYNMDLDKCAEEMKAAEWKSEDGKSLWDTGFRMILAYNSGNTARQSIAEILKQNLEAVNPKFVIEPMAVEWANFIQSQNNNKLPIFIVGWNQDIPDPHNWTMTYTVGYYGIKARMPKEMMDTFRPLVVDGVHATDPAKRAEIYKQFNQAFYDNVPDVLLAQATIRFYFQRWVKGWYNNPMINELLYYSLSKD